MTKLENLALGVMTMALAGTVALELHAGRKPLPAGPVPVSAAPAQSPVPSGAVLLDHADKGRVETVLARPLFGPSRRPPSAVRVAHAQPGSSKLPRLAGIMVDGARRSVIFAPEGSRKPIIVAEGGEFDGFRIDRIEAGMVTVSGLGMHQVLRPSFDPNIAPPATPLAMPPLPAPPPAQTTSFSGPPGLTGMPAIVGAGQGPVTPILPGLSRVSDLTGIPGLGPPLGR